MVGAPKRMCGILTIHSLDPFCQWIFKRVRRILDAVFISAFGAPLHCYEPWQ